MMPVSTLILLLVNLGLPIVALLLIRMRIRKNRRRRDLGVLAQTGRFDEVTEILTHRAPRDLGEKQ
jgi:hypothetical protein